MTKKTKRIFAGLALMLSVTVLAGCGSQDKVGYVNQTKIIQETQKGNDISKKFQDKQIEIMTRLQQAQNSQDAATFLKTQADAQKEMQVFQQALESEFESSLQATAASIAQEKGLTMVTKQGVVVGNGVDITDEVIQKMGKVDPQAKAAAEAKESQANAAQTSGTQTDASQSGAQQNGQ